MRHIIRNPFHRPKLIILTISYRGRNGFAKLRFSELSMSGADSTSTAIPCHPKRSKPNTVMSSLPAKRVREKYSQRFQRDEVSANEKMQLSSGLFYLASENHSAARVRTKIKDLRKLTNARAPQSAMEILKYAIHPFTLAPFYKDVLSNSRDSITPSKLPV